MDVKVDLSNLEKLGKEFPKASARALNNTMRHERTQMVKDAGERYRIKARDLKASMGNQVLAKPTRLSTFFRSKGKRIALTYFMAQANIRQSLAQAGKKIARRAVVSVEITKGNKRKIKGAFAQQMKSGHQGVFTRTGGVAKTGRPAIEERTGPASPQMLSGAFSRLKGVQEYLLKTLAHEIEWFRQGKGGL
jgi:hypothetical protein